ncbi:MAG: hypothetical protein AB7L70_18635 [Pyrinomonadaceae bacterium]
MFNRLKISIVLTPLVLLLVVGVYIYSLWAAENEKAQDLPMDAASMMMRDLLRYHEKRGGFPASLKSLDGIVWEKKPREFSIDGRALTHRRYYYFYSRIDHHHFTLWAIPTGRLREEAVTWFMSVTPQAGRRWKGGALPLDQIDRVDANPTIKELGTLGLIEQSAVDLRSRQKAGDTNVARPTPGFVSD